MEQRWSAHFSAIAASLMENHPKIVGLPRALIQQIENRVREATGVSHQVRSKCFVSLLFLHHHALTSILHESMG